MAATSSAEIPGRRTLRAEVAGARRAGWGTPKTPNANANLVRFPLFPLKRAAVKAT